MTINKNNSSFIMKKNNEQKVLNLIYREETIYRAQLAEKTNLTQQSVTNIVRRLLDKDLIIEYPVETTSVGRNPINLKINNDKLYSIGIEVSTKWIYGVLIDFNKKIISMQKIIINKENTIQHYEDILIKLVNDLLSNVENKEKVKGIGISIEGVVDNVNGVVVNAKKFNWKNYCLREQIEKKFPYPIWLDNDVNMIATVENGGGILSNSNNNITIKFDQGIGGAIVFNKKLYTGSNNIAGEFGHYKSLYGDEAKSCNCGGKGCLTTVASIGALENSFSLDFDEIVYRAGKGEKLFVDEMTKIGNMIGIALANVINFLNPDMVLLTGRLIEKTGEMILPIIKKEVNSNILEFCKNVEIRTIGSNDIAVMAAKLVIEKVFRAPESENNEQTTVHYIL
jgi:transcriptional regulator of PTS gene